MDGASLRTQWHQVLVQVLTANPLENGLLLLNSGKPWRLV
jgi:hypothetical protein